MPKTRRIFSRRVAVAVLAGTFVSMALENQRASAQVPQPNISETNSRSGLLTRFVPLESTLPPDKKRDQWYQTRWGDAPNLRTHPNWLKNGGLYGLPWKAKDGASVYPFFFGSTGPSTLTADSRPPDRWHRLGRAVFHPFKPIGMYYDQGSYVPVYDLDPIVPGPGPWPFARYISTTHGGG